MIEKRKRNSGYFQLPQTGGNIEKSNTRVDSAKFESNAKKPKRPMAKQRGKPPIGWKSKGNNEGKKTPKCTSSGKVFTSKNS